MKAIVYTAYGPPDVLQRKEVEKPSPKDDEVLIKIHATTVTKGDCELRRQEIPNLIWLIVRLFFGLRKPKKKILGLELAGEIESVGKDVKPLREGDQIFATTGSRFGAHAEYVCLPDKYAIAIKPINMTYEEAAAVPNGGLNALHYLRKGNIKPGDRVLINGAAGNFGTFAVQLARYFGAEVTGVDSVEKLDLLRSIGADHVIDYKDKDFTENKEAYDVIFDVICKHPFSSIKRALKPNGRYLLANPTGLWQMLLGKWISMMWNLPGQRGKKIIMEFSEDKTEDLAFLKALIEAGKIRSIVDRCYLLEEIPEAHRYVEKGEKKGHVVITVDRHDNAERHRDHQYMTVGIG